MSTDRIDSEAQLDELQSRPVPELPDLFRALDGDLLVLGAGGKMGPTLARLARRAADESGVTKRVIAVSRYSDPLIRKTLDTCGVETIEADLLDRAQLASLPDARNVLFLAGRKFGSADNLPLTWAMNVLLPGMVMERFAESRIVALSTGNVYPLSRVAEGGCPETHPADPVGEYAQSCLGRERMVQHGSATRGTPAAIIRLNYAIDMRYGVLLDIAQRVRAGTPVDLRTGHVNVIWQRDANAAALLALDICASPPRILNVTGSAVLSVRAIAQHLGALLDREPLFTGVEADTALLSDATQFHEIMPFEKIPIDDMLRWTADWVKRGLPTWNKPTHFETRDGSF
ncbi:MAG: NAD-dependent epimerase/dehydratase family protein [Ignavibacteria bacterium]|nr:NAD-dependent epimerase/dehydratase family protein [Ignavibacteria bacterium]